MVIYLFILDPEGPMIQQISKVVAIQIQINFILSANNMQ